MQKLKQIFKTNWKTIVFSYSLFSINAILMLVYPKVLGNTIDHLITKDYNYIWYLVVTFISLMFFSYVSRIYDVKIFSSIYRRFASIETSNQFDNGVDYSKINGRLTLMKAIVRFFEMDMILIIQTILGVIGSMYFISLASPSIVGLLVITGILIIGTSYYYSPKLASFTKLNNDISEEQTDVINTGNISKINNLLRRGQKIAIQRSVVDSRFSLWVQTIVYGSITGLLTYYVMNNNVTVGSVFSTYRYMFDFCNALLGLPTIITSYLNIKDVVKRLETE